MIARSEPATIAILAELSQLENFVARPDWRLWIRGHEMACSKIVDWLCVEANRQLHRSFRIADSGMSLSTLDAGPEEPKLTSSLYA